MVLKSNWSAVVFDLMLSGFEVARSCHVTYLKSGCQRVLMNWAQGTISLLASLIYNLLVCGQLDLRLPKLQLHGMVIAIGTSEVAVSYLVSLLLPFGELTLTSLSLPPLSSSSSDSCTCSSLVKSLQFCSLVWSMQPSHLSSWMQAQTSNLSLEQEQPYHTASWALWCLPHRYHLLIHLVCLFVRLTDMDVT